MITAWELSWKRLYFFDFVYTNEMCGEANLQLHILVLAVVGEHRCGRAIVLDCNPPTPNFPFRCKRGRSCLLCSRVGEPTTRHAHKSKHLKSATVLLTTSLHSLFFAAILVMSDKYGPFVCSSPGFLSPCYLKVARVSLSMAHPTLAAMQRQLAKDRGARCETEI